MPKIHDTLKVGEKVTIGNGRKVWTITELINNSEVCLQGDDKSDTIYAWTKNLKPAVIRVNRDEELQAKRLEGEQRLPPTEVTPARSAVPCTLAPINRLICQLKGTTPVIFPPTGPTGSQAPHVEVKALAGTGKTTLIIKGMMVQRGLPIDITPFPQQEAVWEQLKLGRSDSVIFGAYGHDIAAELKKRLAECGLDKLKCEAKTMHGMGLKAIHKAGLNVTEDPSDKNEEKIVCELLDATPQQLRKDKPTLLAASAKLAGLCKLNLKEPTHDELDLLSSYYDVDTGTEIDKMVTYDLVPKILERSRDPRGSISFNDMVWLPNVLNLRMWKNDLLLGDEVQDWNLAQQGIARRSGYRLVLCGDEHQCHPSGTLVTTTGDTQVPIETLQIGDQLVSFNPNEGTLVGINSQGRKVENIAARPYSGPLYTINGTPCTSNHKWPTKFCESKRSWTAHYLMELLDGSFRIGITQLMVESAGMFGPGMRAKQEGAVKLWLLEVLEDRDTAREHEYKNSLRYQIPQRAQYEERSDSWARELMNEGVKPQVEQLLKHYGKLYKFPLWTAEESQYIGTRRVSVTQACNLIPEVNLIAQKVKGSRMVHWLPLIMVLEPKWVGTVWSLSVQPTEKDKRLYLANNNVTSNSIFGFAGADVQAMTRLRTELGKEPRGHVCLPLTVTRRCGKAIVEEAKHYVPAFEAHQDNPEGEVKYAVYPIQKDGFQRTRIVPDKDTYLPLVQDGDMVLCRTNAPLVSQCFKQISLGRRAFILGRKIGQGLVALVEKLKASSINDLVTKMEDWKDKESGMEQAKKFPSESRLQALTDKYSCIMTFCKGAATPTDLVQKISSIFTDDSRPGIRHSSIHKAKGLEAQRVFFLQPSVVFSRPPKTEWEAQQKANLQYVGITRAISSLTYVN